MTVALFSACAGMNQHAEFQAVDLNSKLRNGDILQKVDNFAVILDASQSMTEPYQTTSKFLYAKEIASQLNQTIPDLKMGGALTSFGAVNSPFGTRVLTVYGLTDYVKDDLANALHSIEWSGGLSPLSSAMDLTKETLTPAEGRLAIIIISDGKDMDGSPVGSATQLKEAFGNRLCIYTVAVGDDPAGRKVLEEVAAKGECGISVAADDIVEPQAMADFVERVFLGRDTDRDGVPDDADKCPDTPAGAKVDEKGCPLDSDGDGVYDHLDQCPDTPKGARVDERGCWSLGNVLFDFGKAKIKSSAHGYLDEVAETLKNNPSLTVEIAGHTDNVGSAKYNKKLSLRRAKAVANYLNKKGISMDRLPTTGHGFSQPVASNKTKDGRAKNRRTELHPISVK
ncbi:MAG: OmpA family protein [Deltaproteobacteria bacterium]|nr:OmpA family protein [Deltaproteobacteria bacterium]